MGTRAAPVLAVCIGAQAAEYFKIKLHVVPVGRDFRLSAATVRRYLNRNTAILVASAPGFPHGLVDDVEVRIRGQ